MCDRSTDCTNEATCQLVLRNVDTGMETVEYYCNAHLVCRVWEIERDDGMDTVDAIRL